MAQVIHFLISLWPFYLALLGFGLGCLATRIILTPRYCPRCQYYLSWRLQTRAEKDKNGKEEPWQIH